MAAAAYTSKALPLPLHENGTPFQRVDLEFHDVDHSAASYEGRVFLNNADAGLDTARVPAAGYAGSLYIFGHAHCWGDAGHCDPPPGPLHGFDSRPPHHLIPQRHVLEVTETIRLLSEGRARKFSVTVIPVVREKGVERIDHALFEFDRLTLVTYD